MIAVLVCEHTQVLWTGSQLNGCPQGWFVPPAWSCQAAESLAMVRGSSMLHLYVQMQPGIPDCKMGHPWVCEMVIVLYTQLKCNWIWCKYCSVGCAIGKSIFVLCLSSRTPAEPSEPNTVSSRALAGNGITISRQTLLVKALPGLVASFWLTILSLKSS